MAFNLILLVAAAAAIAYSADRFVMGAARTAELTNVSTLIVGVVVIGFGTGLPELTTAALASVHHHPSLGMSSILGSTIVNSTLVLGTLGVISAPKISSSVLRREGAFQLLGVISFGLVAAIWHNLVAYALLVALLAVLVGSMLAGSKNASENAEFEREARTLKTGSQWGISKAVAVTLLGLFAVLASAELLVSSATGIAEHLGISKAVVGATLVALGTSLPELVTSIAAARRGHSDLVIGNIFGSNLFNSTAVAGIAGMISPVKLNIPHLSLEVAIMVVISLVSILFLSSSRRLSRTEGWLLIAFYILWILFASSQALTA